jgi:hypothetical protein
LGSDSGERFDPRSKVPLDGFPVLARKAERSRIGVGVGKVDEAPNDMTDVDSWVLASKEIERVIDGA